MENKILDLKSDLSNELIRILNYWKDQTVDLDVKVMAKHVSESLSEPDGVMKENWRKAQLRPLDICDEVCPEGVNLTQCPVEWLVERCARYHFDLSLTDTNQPALKFVPH